jgi:hypothetical protein
MHRKRLFEIERGRRGGRGLGVGRSAWVGSKRSAKSLAAFEECDGEAVAVGVLAGEGGDVHGGVEPDEEAMATEGRRTRSPGWKSVTRSPACLTVPTASWPITFPNAVGRESVLIRWISVVQAATAVGRISAS